MVPECVHSFSQSDQNRASQRVQSCLAKLSAIEPSHWELLTHEMMGFNLRTTDIYFTVNRLIGKQDSTVPYYILVLFYCGFITTRFYRVSDVFPHSGAPLQCKSTQTVALWSFNQGDGFACSHLLAHRYNTNAQLLLPGLKSDGINPCE